MTSADPIVAVDLFCGAGGFSTGLKQACEALGYGLQWAAINHWEPAIETHATNHPDSTQYHSKVEQLHPPNVVADLLAAGQDADPDALDASVDILLAGPECTHFSNARGGKPVNEQKRMSPWQVLDWLEKLDVDVFVLENVKEIQSWGPVKDGQPTRNGEVFDAWVNALNKLGYSVDWTVLNAADYGDPTSRERFFIAGSQSGQASFPAPPHSEDGAGDTDPWRTAAEIIDWSNLGGSIWTRDLDNPRVTPPKNSTMQRIAEGIRRHCDDRLAPFADALDDLGRDEIRWLREHRVVSLQHADVVADAVDGPFLVDISGVPGQSETSRTLLLRQQDGAHPVDVRGSPVPTIATRGGHAITTVQTQPLIAPKNGRYRDLYSNPLYPVADRPIHTITADPRAKLVTPLVTPFIDDYEGPAASIDAPLGTVTSRDRFALCVPALWPWGLDVRYRMLNPTELKQAQGFPPDYEIVGTKTETTEQIGNAVPVNLARELCTHLLSAADPDLSTYGGGAQPAPDYEVPDYEDVVADD